MRKTFDKFRIVEILYLLLALIVPLQRYFFHHYNNFTIYQHSTFHFFAKANLYIEYPKEYYDAFLYNPVFALLFTPFSYLPTVAGIFLWVAFLLTIYYFSIRLLPFDKNSILFIFGFTFIELITSVENLQVNCIVAAFMLFTYIYIENKKVIKASVFTNLGFFIKGFGAISGILFIAKRSKFRDYLYLLCGFIIFLCLPLVYYSTHGLITLYKQWFDSLSSEHSINSGISLMGIMSSLFMIKMPVIYIQLFGLIFMIITVILVFYKKNYEQVKSFLLSYIMIGIIIFNHDSESATYIIATTGVAIWYINSARSWLDTILLVITFILTVMSPSDLFPHYLNKHYVIPYCLKALGPSLIWLKIQYSIFFPEKHLPALDKG